VVLISFALPAFEPVVARAQKQGDGTREINLTATSANVNESGSPVRIRILRWSTDDERTPIVAALTPIAPGTAPGGGAPGGPTAASGANPAAAARGARGAGRGARGARGGRGDAGAPSNPMAVLTAALGREPTIGYIWTTEVTGYAIRYAYHAALPDGGERIILATDRRLGAHSTAWKPLDAAAVTDYEFTLLEIRLDW